MLTEHGATGPKSLLPYTPKVAGSNWAYVTGSH